MTGDPDFRQLHDDDWEKPSLCAGWRVRDVVGHILYGNELNLLTLPFKLARHGFSSDRSGRINSIARAQGRRPAQLCADFDTRKPWAGTARVFPPRLTLLDRLVHHQDIRRALVHPRQIPAARVLPLLAVAPKLGTVFGSKRRSRGLRLEATDLEWSWGDGPAVRGPGEAILMAVLGRRAAVADLEGDGVTSLAARCAAAR